MVYKIAQLLAVSTGVINHVDLSCFSRTTSSDYYGPTLRGRPRRDRHLTKRSRVSFEKARTFTYTAGLIK